MPNNRGRSVDEVWYARSNGFDIGPEAWHGDGLAVECMRLLCGWRTIGRSWLNRRMDGFTVDGDGDGLPRWMDEHETESRDWLRLA